MAFIPSLISGFSENFVNSKIFFLLNASFVFGKAFVFIDDRPLWTISIRSTSSNSRSILSSNPLPNNTFTGLKL